MALQCFLWMLQASKVVKMFSPAKWLSLLPWLVLCIAPGAIGAITSQPDAWYEALNKPSWNPPNWVFGPVWTTLYVMIAISGWRVSPRLLHDTMPLALFLIQLLLNALWSPIFFGWHRPGLAFAEILVLWGFIVATVVAFYRIDRLAGLLLLPYLAWVSFASVLNGTIWWLNR